jgi:hypothetical protein
MNEQRKVETVEEFKLRIASIIRGKIQEIPSPRRAESAAAPSKGASLCTFTKFGQEKINAAST